jgi:ribosomal protein L11 methyltransferase
MPRSHIELAIGTETAAFDTITGALSIEGFEGFWEDGNILRAYIAEDRWHADRLDGLRMNLARITSDLALPPPSLTLTPVADQNWNRSWEETIRPIRVTERIVIAPTWHPFTAGPGDIVLTIDPKMSFGTGYHETTRLMLGLLERHLTSGARVLDAGTGTGILAIAALKLGAASALGFDIDEWSYANALENARLNGVSGLFTVRQGDLPSVTESGFDLIAANIQKNVIEEMLPGLVSRLAPAGTLLVSGLLTVDRDSIVATLTGGGLALEDERREGEWIAYAGKLT